MKAVLFAALLVFACVGGGATAQDSESAGAADPVGTWDAIVGEFATDDGGFRYEALMADTDATAGLDAVLAYFAETDTSAWERDDRLAFLINAYNAYTVKSVVELWPVESVLQEEGFFDGRTHVVSGVAMTLNTLENDHIRAAFGEPRIHFLVNCASTGCPPLVDDAVTADNLEALLDRQTRAYVRDTVVVADGSVQMSQIFEWFAGDFEAAGGVRAFVAGYLEEPAASHVRDTANAIGYTPYDWSLNARP